MYMPNFLDGFDRLVAFDAETTGKRTPDAEFIQPFAWRAPGIIIEVGFVEQARSAGADLSVPPSLALREGAAHATINRGNPHTCRFD
jgi:hypothetical protein